MVFWLDVPYAEKDEAKRLGARWDPRRRSWYVPEGVRLTDLEKWVPIASGTAPDPTSAAPPGRARPISKGKPGRTQDLFGETDVLVGKTVVGKDYFDTGHDCIPWEPCAQCEAAVLRRKKKEA